MGGLEVIEIDGLTGLPEYRNGGLFLDTGVIALKDPATPTRAHAVGDACSWWNGAPDGRPARPHGRPIRAKLGFAGDGFPLAKALEGGTWAAAGAIRRRRSAAGSPPLSVISDGTVF